MKNTTNLRSLSIYADFFSPEMVPCSQLEHQTLTKLDPIAPNIRLAWETPESKLLLTKVIKDGIFSSSPELADGFLLEIDKLSQSQFSSAEIYERLRSYIDETSNSSLFTSLYCEDEKARVERRVQQISNLFKGLDTPQSLCDIGCGFGKITTGVAKALEIPAHNAIGIDVFDRVAPSDGFTPCHTEDESVLPIEDNSVDAVMLLMVLHHHCDLESIMKEIERVLKPGGRVVLREVNAETESQKLFHSVLDHIYYSVYSTFPGIPEPENHQSADYWQNIFEKNGFITETKMNPEPMSPINPVHFVFVKN